MVRSIWFYPIAFTILTCSVVTCSVFLIYPHEDWVRELVLGNFLASTMTFSITFYIGKKLRRIEELSRELQHLVDRDRLTDMSTRDHFFRTLSMTKNAYGVSLMVDIDHFKAINDVHGHLAGDVVIKRVAEALKQQTRARDIVCRFGGEEFVIFLFEATADVGHDIAERMRAAVAEQGHVAGALPFSVTVSIGGSLKSRFDDIEAAIKQADDALYRAKRAGRNRTIFAQSAMA